MVYFGRLFTKSPPHDRFFPKSPPLSGFGGGKNKAVYHHSPTGMCTGSYQGAGGRLFVILMRRSRTGVPSAYPVRDNVQIQNTPRAVGPRGLSPSPRGLPRGVPKGNKSPTNIRSPSTTSPPTLRKKSPKDCCVHWNSWVAKTITLEAIRFSGDDLGVTPKI